MQLPVSHARRRFIVVVQKPQMTQRRIAQFGAQDFFLQHPRLRHRHRPPIVARRRWAQRQQPGAVAVQRRHHSGGAPPFRHPFHHLGGRQIPQRLRVEKLRQTGLHPGQLPLAQPAQIAMIRQHHQARIIESDQRHHRIIVGQRRRIGALGVPRQPVLPRRLITMMPIGQKHRTPVKKIGNRGKIIGPGYAPHCSMRAEIIAGVHLRRRGHRPPEPRHQFPAGIAVQRHNRADVGRHRLHQRNPIADGRSFGKFVGQHLSGFIFLQPDAGNQPQPRAFPPVQDKSVAQQIIPRLGILP